MKQQHKLKNVKEMGQQEEKKSARKYLHMNIECGVYRQWIFIFVLYK